MFMVCALRVAKDLAVWSSVGEVPRVPPMVRGQ